MKYTLIILLAIIGFNAHGITVTGNNKYQIQVNKCLRLLSLKAKSEYKIIKTHIGIIAQSDKSGMWAWENPPRYSMSDKTAFYSITWCAGTIAHDAYHSFLYHKYVSPSGEKPPYDKWGGVNAEKLAIDFQVKVMKKIGASKHEINYLQTLDGTHGDTNKDGKLDWDDYKQRRW